MDFLDELLTLSPRGIRYFVAMVIVVAGIVCGAVINSSVGGTVCTVLAAVGCLALIRMIVVDVGWTEQAQAAREADRLSRLGLDRPSDDGAVPDHRRTRR